MSDHKRIDRLEDWFDAAIDLGSDADLSSLTGRLPVYRVRPTTRLSDDAALIDGVVSCSGGPSSERAVALRTLFHAHGVRRPLILTSEGDFSDLLAAWPEPFRLGPGLESDVPVQSEIDLGALEQAILAALNAGIAVDKRLNILVLYNDHYTHIESTREHLKAFGNHSRHNYFFMPAAETLASDDPRRRTFDDYAGAWPQAWDLSVFDAVIWHYVLPAYKSAEGYVSDYMAARVAERLALYDGLKILFAQDEYDSTATIWQSIRRAGINLVMSVVPPAGIAFAYPSEQLPGVEVISTLTGFVPDGLDLSRYALPMAQRDLRIAYRGRILPYRYGSLGREKYEIGVRMKAETAARGVAADIELTEDKRIYGEDWYRFLGSARGMLATESGSNVFDFDGTLHATEAAAEGQPFDAFFAEHLAHREGHIEMNQISPKVFEAISLRTALVCFEGRYSDVIQPEVHFIPLKKDFSNVEEVLNRLEDVEALTAMTDRAYRDVIQSGLYSYGTFVERFDRIVDSRVWRPARAEIISAPIVRRRRGQSHFEPIARREPFDYILNTGVLHGAYQRRQLEADMGAVQDAQSTILRHQPTLPPEDAWEVFSAGPEAVRCYEVWSKAGAALNSTSAGARITTPAVAWHYAAGVHLDFTAVDFAGQHCWVQIEVSDVEGDVLTGLYDAERDVLSREHRIIPDPARQTLSIPAFEPRGSLLVFRTGEHPASAQCTVLAVSILAASAYQPGVLEIARALSEAKGLRD